MLSPVSPDSGVFLGPVNTNLIASAGAIFVTSSALASCFVLATMIPIVEDLCTLHNPFAKYFTCLQGLELIKLKASQAKAVLYVLVGVARLAIGPRCAVMIAGTSS